MQGRSSPDQPTAEAALVWTPRCGTPVRSRLRCAHGQPYRSQQGTACLPACLLPDGDPAPQHAYLWVPRKDWTESNGSFPGRGGLASGRDHHPKVNGLLPGAWFSLLSELGCRSPQKGVSGGVLGPEGSAMRGSGPASAPHRRGGGRAL